MIDEIEVICSQCSFPTVTILDDDGKTVGFREEPGPKTEEEALTQGWLDTGLGLLCPSCTTKHAIDVKREQDQGVESGAGSERRLEIKDAVSKTTYYGMLKGIHPEVSEETIGLFTQLLLDHERGEELKFPEPKDEAQAAEYLIVAETVKKAMVKK